MTRVWKLPDMNLVRFSNLMLMLLVAATFVLQVISAVVSEDDVNEIVLQRLQNYETCNFSQFFSIATKTCEDCSKYCLQGLDSENCPRRCAGYLNKLAMDRLKSGYEESLGNLQEHNAEMEATTLTWETVTIAAFAILGLLMVGVCVYFVTRYITQRRKKTSSSEQISLTNSGQPQPANGQADNRAFGGHVEAANNRQEPLAGDVVVHVPRGGTVQVGG